MKNSEVVEGIVRVPLFGIDPDSGSRGIIVGHAIIDQADAAAVLEFRWNRSPNGYASTNIRKGHPLWGEDERKRAFMHQVVVGGVFGSVIDHINRDKLDNRRCNLRIVTKRENILNSEIRSTNTSGFRGVSWESQTGKWRATANKGKKRISAGRFESAVEAALAADWAAWQLHGEDAILNFPERIIR